jgi:hypothetical protein
LQPKFAELANTWQGIHDSLGFANNCADLVQAIRGFSEDWLQDVDVMVNGRLKDVNAPPSIEEFLSPTEGEVPYDQIRGGLARRTSFSDDDSFLETQV